MELRNYYIGIKGMAVVESRRFRSQALLKFICVVSYFLKVAMLNFPGTVVVKTVLFQCRRWVPS